MATPLWGDAAAKETAPMGKTDEEGGSLLKMPIPGWGGKTSYDNEVESKRGGGPDPTWIDRLPGRELVQGTETSSEGHGVKAGVSGP